jgi:monoamine oxidase
MKESELRRSVEARLHSGMQNGLDLDVAVVGAGMAGLYAAWRLVDGRSPPPSVHIVELDNRIGGRLESVVLPGMEISGELGGMRYLTSQMLVTSLIERRFAAQLKPVDFPMGDPSQHFFYGRTRRCRASAWTDAQSKGQKFVTNYALRPDLVGFDSDQLFNKVIYDVLVADPWFYAKYVKGPPKPKVSHPSQYSYVFELTSMDWDDVKPQLTYSFPGPYQDMKVNDLGFWNVIKDQAAEEAYEFLSVAGGYYSNTINWNAAEAMPYMVGDFSDAETVYKTIDGGYDQIAYAIAQAYLAQPGTRIWTGNRLLGFDRAPPGSGRRYRLTIRNLTSATDWTIDADAIVLAMPRKSLELLDQSNFFFGNPAAQPLLRQNVESVTIEPAFKLLMGFEAPWWVTDFGTHYGESITDLPMRQCYYFGQDPDDSHSLFLASYNDMRTVSFWKPLEPGGQGHDLFQPRATRRAAARDLARFEGRQATRAMVGEAMTQVRELHGAANIPDPYVTYFKDWSQDPYGGGYHAWKAGVQVKNVMPYMRRPNSHEAIHVIGEAYSDQQGWVEGALCVAERMLEEHFGRARPDWLIDPGYYLGW